MGIIKNLYDMILENNPRVQKELSELKCTINSTKFRTTDLVLGCLIKYYENEYLEILDFLEAMEIKGISKRRREFENL